jgi:hypothetical protein
MKYFFFVFTLLGFATFVQAQDKPTTTDRVVLTDGSVLYGTIVSYDADKGIKLQTLETTMDIPKSRITSFEQGVQANSYYPKPSLSAPVRKGWYGKLGASFGVGAETRYPPYANGSAYPFTNTYSHLAVMGVFGRQFNERWGVGIGTGIGIGSDNNIVPIFAEGRYFFSKKPTSAFASLAVGAAIPLESPYSNYNYYDDYVPRSVYFDYSSRVTAGSYIYPSIGWQVASRSQTHFWFDIGLLHYDYTSYFEHSELTSTTYYNKNRLMLRLGIDIQ